VLIWTCSTGEISRLRLSEVLKYHNAGLLPAIVVAIPWLVRSWVNRVLAGRKQRTKLGAFVWLTLMVFLVIGVVHGLYSRSWGWGDLPAGPGSGPAQITEKRVTASSRSAVVQRRVTKPGPAESRKTERFKPLSADETSVLPGLTCTRWSNEKITEQRVVDRVSIEAPAASKGKPVRSQWKGYISIPGDGERQFSVQTNIPCVIRMNGRILFEKSTRNEEEMIRLLHLTAGRYSFSVEMQERDHPVFLLLWGKDQLHLSEITNPYFFHSPK
jgi:hypothetical protein